MASKFYLHDSTTTVTGTLPTSANYSSRTPNVTATGAGTNRATSTVAGSAQVAIALTSAAISTQQWNWFRRFVSPPIAAFNFNSASGGTQVNFTANIGVLTSSANSAFDPILEIDIWRPSTGAHIANIGSAASTISYTLGAAAGIAEIGSSPAWNVAPSDGAAAVAQDGDVLLFQIWGTLTQAMSTAFTWTFDYDGTVDPVSGTTISSAASYVSTSVDIPLYMPAKNRRTILQAVNRAATWCKHERRDSGLYTPRRRVLLPTSS